MFQNSGTIRGFLAVLSLGLLSFANAAPPAVVSTAPANGAGDDIRGAALCVTLSAPMDHPSTQGAFSVLPATAGTFAWSGATGAEALAVFALFRLLGFTRRRRAP